MHTHYTTHIVRYVRTLRTTSVKDSNDLININLFFPVN